MLVSQTNKHPFYLSKHPTTELRRQKSVLSVDRRAQEPYCLLYKRLWSLLDGQLQQLKSRHSFVPAALELLDDPAQ